MLKFTPRHEDVYFSGSIAPLFLDLGAKWMFVLASHTFSFPSGAEARGTHWMGSWVNHSSVWTRNLREKHLTPIWNQTPIIQSIV